MKQRLLVVVLLLGAACESVPAPSYAPSSSPVAVSTAASPPLAAPTSSATPTRVATPPPSPLPTREIAGVEFALVSGAADLRIETALSRDDDEIVAATVAAYLA